MDATTARTRIVAGELRGSALLDALLAILPADREPWIDTVLGIPPPPPDRDLPRGAVPYLPAGVDEIIALVREVPLRATDELVDLGSGLGRVLVLAHLLSGARAHGIELQAHLVERARATCAELRLSAVGFEQANAADTRLAVASRTVTPCASSVGSGVEGSH
ncbi:MAG: methyltransferase domain-containing protein, partial [Polyangiales bacterium]